MNGVPPPPALELVEVDLVGFSSGALFGILDKSLLSEKEKLHRARCTEAEILFCSAPTQSHPLHTPALLESPCSFSFLFVFGFGGSGLPLGPYFSG